LQGEAEFASASAMSREESDKNILEEKQIIMSVNLLMSINHNEI
jgi:hypothetical protein